MLHKFTINNWFEIDVSAVLFVLFLTHHSGEPPKTLKAPEKRLIIKKRQDLELLSPLEDRRGELGREVRGETTYRRKRGRGRPSRSGTPPDDESNNNCSYSQHDHQDAHLLPGTPLGGRGATQTKVNHLNFLFFFIKVQKKKFDLLTTRLTANTSCIIFLEENKTVCLSL